MEELRNHVEEHIDDFGSAFQCSKCPQRHASLYLLADHEGICEGQLHVNFTKPDDIQRILLAPRNDTAPRSIILAQGSWSAPKAWYRKQKTLEEGLRILGREVIWQYQIANPAPLPTPAVVSTLGGCSSKCTPAFLPFDEGNLDKLRLATRFTDILKNDLIQASKSLAGTSRLPVVVSLGWDGWTCHIGRIKRFLQDVKQCGVEFWLTLAIGCQQMRYRVPRNDLGKTESYV